MSEKKPANRVGNWIFETTDGEMLKYRLDVGAIVAQMAAIEDRATLSIVLGHLRSKGFVITDPDEERQKARATDDGWQDHSPLGWWEYGVGGMRNGGTGEEVEPSPYMNRVEAENYVTRWPDKLYLVRRWVRPEAWEVTQ